MNLKIYNGTIHGANTLEDIFRAGYTRCDSCRGKRFSGSCLHHLDSDMLDGEPDPNRARSGGFCRTTRANYSRDLTRYGVGRM